MPAFNKITIVPITEGEEDDTSPSPSKPGRVLLARYLDDKFDDFEVLDYDNDSACFWAQEGIGLDYLVEDIIGLPDDQGCYIVHGITVSFTRGDGWMTDDDEVWNWERIEKLDCVVTQLPDTPVSR